MRPGIQELVQDAMDGGFDIVQRIFTEYARHNKSPKAIAAQYYRQEVQALRASLNDDATKAGAREHIRALVDKIVLTPKPDQQSLAIDLHSDLAGILKSLL
jgi:hypothetical protein